MAAIIAAEQAEHILPIITWASAAALLFLLSTQACRRISNFGLEQPPTPHMAAARIVSTLHATMTFLGAASLTDMEQMKSPTAFAQTVGTRYNTEADIALLHFSCGYFAMDLIYILLLERDTVFVIHHLISLILWGTTLYIGRGAELCICCLLMGESTTGLLNMWWLTKRAGHEQAARLFSRTFTFGFLAVRVCILPFFVYAFAREALTGDAIEQRVGRPMARLWACMVVLSMVGGLVWARALGRGFLKDLKKTNAKKAK